MPFPFPVSPLNGLHLPVDARRVALVGGNALTARQAPLEDPSWHVWGCNSLWKQVLNACGQFRADAWFELHPLEVQTPEELQAMHDCPVPLYVLDRATARLARQDARWMPYPLVDVLHHFKHPPYFHCTMAYQVALALTQGYREIGLFGIELYAGTERERIVEHANLMYWVGLARGLGVRVTFPHDSLNARSEYLYGYEYGAEKETVDHLIMRTHWVMDKMYDAKVGEGLDVAD